MNAHSDLSNKPSRPFVLLIHWAFLLIGTGTIQLGVILPALASRLALDDAQSGALSAAQYSGSICGTFLTSFFWKRFGFLPTLVGGLILMAAGTLGLAFPSIWQAAVFCIFLNGMGVGITIPTANMLVAAFYPHKSAAALNILNFMWGVGALLCASFYGLFGTIQNVDRPLIIFAAILFLTALSFLPFNKITVGKDDAALENPKSKVQSPESIWLTAFALVCAGLLFLAVGVENSLGYWLTTFALRLDAAENSLFTVATSVFWTAFLSARLFAPLALRRLSEAAFVLCCLLLTAFGMTIILLAVSQTILAAGTLLAGAGLAPLFPTILAQFTTRYGAAAQSQVKYLFMVSTFGGATLTWLVGIISKNSGDLRNGLLAALVGSLLMIVLQILIMKKSKAAIESP